MNQGIPLSLGCTGNALSNQRTIDNEEATCLPPQVDVFNECGRSR